MTMTMSFGKLSKMFKDKLTLKSQHIEIYAYILHHDKFLERFRLFRVSLTLTQFIEMFRKVFISRCLDILMF